jgi:hypothetical protein
MSARTTWANRPSTDPYDVATTPENPSNLPDIPLYITLIAVMPDEIVPVGALYNEVRLPSLDDETYAWISDRIGEGRYVYVMTGDEVATAPSRVVTVSREEYEAILMAIDAETAHGYDAHRSA